MAKKKKKEKIDYSGFNTLYTAEEYKKKDSGGYKSLYTADEYKNVIDQRNKDINSSWDNFLKQEKQRKQQQQMTTVQTPTYYYDSPYRNRNSSGSSTGGGGGGNRNSGINAGRMIASAGVSDTSSKKKTGSAWDQIKNQRIRERQAFPKFMTERPEDYNDHDEDYDRKIYDFYYGKGEYDKISKLGKRDDILRRNADIRDLWNDFDNGNVAKVAESLQEQNNKKENKQITAPEQTQGSNQDISPYEKRKWINKTISELEKEYNTAKQETDKINAYENPQGMAEAEMKEEDLLNKIYENKKLLKQNDAAIAKYDKDWTKGNIDLNNRPVVQNADGTVSTVRSITVGYDDGYYVLPTVIDGKIVSDKEAEEHFEQTGEYVGRFKTQEEADYYAEKLHNKEAIRTGGTVKLGGDTQEMTPYEMYESTDPKLRGKMSELILKYDNYQDWLNSHPYATKEEKEKTKAAWDAIHETGMEWVEEQREIGANYVPEWNQDEIGQEYTNLIHDLPQFADNPERNEQNDRDLYNYMYGEYGTFDWYENNKNNPDFKDELDEMWKPLLSGEAAAIAKEKQEYEAFVKEWDYQSAMIRQSEKEMKLIDHQEELIDKYGKFINTYGDVKLKGDYYVPEYDKGGGQIYGLSTESAGGTSNIDRIYSLVSGGKELTYWAAQQGDNPQITSDYRYAMMMLNGENGNYDEIGKFCELYLDDVTNGREPKQAEEFLNGLKPYLENRYSEAEKIGFSEFARNYPVAASGLSLLARQANTYMDVFRHIGALLGDAEVQNIDSVYYAFSRYANQIEGTIANDIGGFGAKIYTNVMNSMSNMMRALSSRGIGASSKWANTALSLGGMFLQVDQEATAKYLEKYDYETASKWGAIDGLFEVLQEFLPFEAMLGSEGLSVWKALRINVLSEVGQEFSGASWFKPFEWMLKGENENQARADEIIARKGYEDSNGEWKDLSYLSDFHEALVEAAKLRADHEFWMEAIESGLAGGFGGAVSSTYGSIARISDTNKLGKSIKSDQNTVDGETGVQRLVGMAAGMEGTKSQKLAVNAQAKMNKGKTPSDYAIGKLALTMSSEANDQVKDVISETVQRRILGQLRAMGVTRGAKEMADAITRGLTGDKMTKADRETIAKDERAIKIWQSYNSFMSEDYAGVREDVDKATEPIRSVANLIGDMTGKYNKATGAIADEIDEVNRTAKTMDEAIDTLAKRNAGLISEEYAALAKQEAGTEGNKNHQKTFLNDAVQIRLAAMTLNRNMPKTNIDQESAKRLWEAAQKEFQDKDAQRIKNQAPIVPGKGKITYEGEAYGSDGWQEKLRSLKGPVRQQVQAIAYIANRLGHTVNFEYDDSVVRDENGKVVSDSRFVHGYESGSGAITINVAGMLASGARKNMMVTIAHEMTHWLEQNSAEGYAALRQFLLDNLRARGMNVEQRMADLISNQRSVLKGTGQELDLTGAMAELVAQSCEELMSSQELINRLEAENPGLHAKIKNFLRNLISKLTTGAEDSLSQEARLVRDLKEDIAKMWFAARDEALNREAGGEEAGEGVSFSVAKGKQLEDVGIGYDIGEKTSYSLAAVKPVQSSNKNIWQPGHSEAWFRENGFPIYMDVSLEQQEINRDTSKKGHGTQIASTESTYRKLFNRLKEDHPDTWQDMRILDASSGLGLGTKAGREMGFNVTDIEPFPAKNYHPDYTDYMELQEQVESGKVEPFDYIISNAVLNVIPQDTRDNLVAAMGSLLKQGGSIFVNVISKDYSGAVNSNPNIQESLKNRKGSARTMEGDYSRSGNAAGRGHETFVWGSNSVQKVFSTPELIGYLKDALGDGYTVKRDSIGMTGVTVTSNAEGDVSYSVASLYDYDNMIKKPDMSITAMDDISSNVVRIESGKTTRDFAKDVISDIRDNNNGSNEIYNKDTKKRIQIVTESIKHSIGRNLQKAYIQISRNIVPILQNAVAVNELDAREGKTNGSTILIGMAETNDSYYAVRFVVDNKTWKADSYDILYSISKSEIKKDGSVIKTPGLRAKGPDSGTPSTITIAGMLELVKNAENIAAVLSTDVAERLEINRPFVKGISEGLAYSVAQMDQDYEAAQKANDTEAMQRIVDEAAEAAMPDSKVRGKDGKLLKMFHGTGAEFNQFRRDYIGSTGRFEGSGFNFTPYEGRASSYGKNVMAGYLDIQNTLSAEKKTISIAKLAKIIREADPTGDNIIADYARETSDYGSESFVRRESMTAARNIWESSDNDVDIYSFISAADSDAEGLIAKFEELGYDGLIHYDENGNIKTAVAFSSNQFKRADPVTYDDNHNPINLSERFNMGEQDIRYAVAQIDQGYRDAVNSGDMDIAQWYVNEAADRAGYTDRAFHGTKLFGFTRFDLGAGQDTIFVSYDKKLAATYMRTDPETREISDRNGVPVNPYVLKEDELVQLAEKVLNESMDVIRIEKGDDHEDSSNNGRDKFKVTYKDSWTGEETSTNYRRFELWNAIEEWQNPNGEYDGMYDLYTKPGNQLVIDAKGNSWNEIPFDLDWQDHVTVDAWGNEIWDEDLEGFVGGEPFRTTRYIAEWAKRNGYDSVRINNVHDNGGRNWQISNDEGYGDIGIFFNETDVKSADAVTYDDQGKVIPPSERFNPNEGDIRFSVAQLAEANGFRFDEDAVALYDKEGRLIDGVKVKVTEDMIEKTPIGMLINMARDGFTTKKGKVKFAATIDEKTAQAQKKMFADLMNMVARYKDSNLVWEIAGSTLYSALKANSDPQYKTTVDFGTVCAKTQEIINVMSRVMLEKGRGMTREEVLMVYNETANAGLTVPCPVCYVFSRWMGVPSLLNSISQYQKRFVIPVKDAKGNPVYDKNGRLVIDAKKTEKAAQQYIAEAMAKYESKANLDKAKTSIMNRMKTQEKNRTEALVVANSKTATAEEKQQAKIKHDEAIKALDSLTKDLAEVEAYNWVTQALCKETSNGSGKYVFDPEFEFTPDNILFDLRKTGEFAKFAKNWRYRNTRGAGMGKAIMPYSGMSIGDIIYGTERKSDIKNSFLQMKAGSASTAMRNAIIRARKQNLVGGQRLQSTSDFRPEWGLDYIMTFLELQAIGSKVQMYTKVAEAVDLLASMGADVNLSIMGAGSGFHIATEAEIREAKKNTKLGRDLRSRMGTTYDENGKMQTYILDFSDVTGMDYNTAKALKDKHHSVQMILVGMNDIHIRLAMMNPDIDFIIPWHSSGNTQDALRSMIASVGEKLETSSDYQDTQSDKPAANQTAAQKQLWDLRMKILQGKNITAAEKAIIDKDEWLSALWERFNVEGVDPDCYQVEMDADQAGQIFPYEYWEKGLMKARANENGQRFIEYCQHFGITPRFSGVVKTNEDGTFTVTGNFAGAIYDDKGNITGYDPKQMTDGYWKVLIDRPMYDNNGRYRDQQVVDVTKARVGSLDEEGRLQDSDMPLKTSAMYGDGYSEQEKTATDNTLAALDTKAKLEAIGKNVLDDIQPVRPNQSAFGASAGVPTMNTQAVSEQEVIAPAKQKARYADDDSLRMSVVQPDMEVSTFMLGLNENSLSTSQEKIMLRQFKEIRKTMEVAQMALGEREKDLKKLEAKANPTAYDKEEMQKLRNQIKNWQGKYDRSVAQLSRITTGSGYAKLMQQQEKIMRDLVSGRTYEEVRQTVETLTKMMEDVTKEIENREKRISDLRDDLAYRKTATLINRPAVEKVADMIRKEYGSTLSKKDLIRELTTIRLKMARKMDIENDVMNLAWKIAESTAADGGESLRSLRGTTITLGAGQVKELLGTDGSLKELRSIFAGTGIQIRTAKEGKAGLDADWQQLCDAVPELDRNAKELDQVNELIRFVRNQKSQLSSAGMLKGNMDEFAEDLTAMAATIGMNTPNDPEAVKILNEMSKLVDSMAAGVQTSTEELRKARMKIMGLINQGVLAMSQQDAMQYDIERAIKYNNALTEQSEAELWKSERRKLIDQLNSETTEKLIAEQQKWKERIARDKTARDMMQSNMQLRKSIHTNVTRLRKLLVNETDLKNIPEHMKSLTREMLGMIVRNDINGRKLTGIAKQDLIELARILDIMEDQDGAFTLDDLKMITDEEAQSVVEDALADIEDGIKFYNASSRGGILTTLQGLHNALDRISEAVSTITSVIKAEQEISIGDRKILVADAAEEVAYDMKNSRFKGETRGRGSRQINMARKAVLWGNLTPVYFFRNLRNRGMMKQWKELTSAENRNGLELQKAEARIREIAEKANYKEWTGQTHKVKFGGRTFDITIDQMMSLYAIWRREKEQNPEMSNHLQQGGVYFDVAESTDGKLRKERTDMRPVKISDEDVGAMYAMLTDEQKTYVDEMVSYLSNDMSELGNEASMKMYGIKKYKEKWYFPMQVWDGVKSARSDKGISGTNENRAAHKRWSKRRINKANNALVIGDFTQIAVGHIVEMINYNTVAPAIENINKILNYKRNEQAEPGNPDAGSVKRNIRIMFQQAYGQQALNYLETFLKDLNGGTVQDQRKTLREAALSMFKKNAVAGSLSVALQQPLSYIRAAMMINPMYLARALNPTYWKGSQAEMMKYSGVAVIKAMGRFDMNFGRSAKDFVAPEKNESIYSRVSDILTAAPELMDTMTWTRMWSAVKIEQHKAHPEMDMNSNEFLKIVAERFNELMQRTQVYDSVMVKSQNMRSQNYAMKIITSFMAEPTLSLNVLADAVQGAITKNDGWKGTLAKAGATFALSAVAQAFVKGLMGSGRTPDEKKTWLENFLYKWYSAFLNEINPAGLVPGYSDIIELIKNGELNDDAMGAIGKIFTTLDTANKAIQGKGKGWYRDLEDTAAQLAQLFTNVPAKNIMRDLRAMFNWISQEPYADRETSGAVLKMQRQAAFWNADSLIGAINTKLGEAGYQTSNKSYYGRMFDAMQRGDQAEVDDIREYMTLAKGVKEETIESGLKTAAKDRMDTVEADEWMIKNNMMNSSSTITTQYIKGEITKDEYKKLLKKQNPKMTTDEIWWAVDQADFKKETGVDSKPTGKNYRLDAAIEANSTEAIRKAINEMTAHGVDKKNIKSQYLSKWKDDYLEAGSDKRRKIRDALQKAYKILGYTAEDANKTIEKWESDAKKKN